MALKQRAGGTKGSSKRSSKSSSKTSSKSSSSRPSTSQSSSALKSPSKSRSALKRKHTPTASKALTTAKNTTKKPPHLRYTTSQLRVPELNGIKPTGIQKSPNQKKGKVFVDDGDGMRTILALVMAEKEGNIESKVLRARQLEEVREAKRVEAERRVESKKAKFDGKKEEVRLKGRKGKAEHSAETTREERGTDAKPAFRPSSKVKKRVSFG